MFKRLGIMWYIKGKGSEVEQIVSCGGVDDTYEGGIPLATAVCLRHSLYSIRLRHPQR